MDMYRIYGLDANGHIRHGEYVDCSGDSEAVGEAYRLLDRHRAAEVWFGARRVASPAELALYVKR